MNKNESLPEKRILELEKERVRKEREKFGHSSDSLNEKDKDLKKY